MKGEGLIIESLEKRYNERPVVADVSMHVKQGEFVSLLGPSGSGKTTLLMMIAGFEIPDSGRIAVGSRDITFLAANKRDVGMVFQKYALFPHMTVAQNIAFPLRMRRRPKAEIRSRVSEMLALVQLEGYDARYPSQLSGGQQQRVAVARALVAEPPVLLMDEPLSALDKKLRETMQFEIKRIQQQVGVTVVYVTHDQEEALTMSDRVAVMSDGRLVQIGEPCALYQRPASPFVADFIGRMNFLDGTVAEQGDGSTAVRISDAGTVSTGLIGQRSCGAVKAGDRVKIAIRPEHLKLVPLEHDRGSDFVMQGKLESSVFVGASQIFVVQVGLEATHRIQVQAPSSVAIAKFRPGDRVGVVADTGAMHLYANEAAR